MKKLSLLKICNLLDIPVQVVTWKLQNDSSCREGRDFEKEGDDYYLTLTGFFWMIHSQFVTDFIKAKEICDDFYDEANISSFLCELTGLIQKYAGETKKNAEPVHEKDYAKVLALSEDVKKWSSHIRKYIHEKCNGEEDSKGTFSTILRKIYKTMEKKELVDFDREEAFVRAKYEIPSDYSISKFRIVCEKEELRKAFENEVCIYFNDTGMTRNENEKGSYNYQNL